MTKALVIEDDDRMMEAIADTLFTLGHEHEWATNLQDARELIRSKEFDYGLFDLEIPAKPGRGFANTEHGVRALEEFKQERDVLAPTIVMTGHHVFCMNHANSLRSKGAVDFIAKPFPLEGRTLGHVIRQILPTPQAAESPAGTTFQGGPLVFRRTTVELLGIPIVSNRGAGQAMTLLRELARQDTSGTFIHRSADDLVQILGPPANIGTVTSCVRLLRSNTSTRLKKDLGLVAHPHDLIAHNDKGYFLRDWLTVQYCDSSRSDVPLDPSRIAKVSEGASEITDGLNPRQLWVLKELQRGVHVERAMLENRFGIADKTAKRDLEALKRDGVVDFVRTGCGGHYRLVGIS